MKKGLKYISKATVTKEGHINQLTVKDLRAALAMFGPGYDNQPVAVWLPGSRIDLANTLFVRDGAIMIEGNVRPGSALER